MFPPFRLLVPSLLMLCFGCDVPPSPMASDVSYGPPITERRPPTDAPTLDYESMMGLDPQTVQTNTERQRNNDHAWRIDRLERQVRDLNQTVRGIREIRIGESSVSSDSPLITPANETLFDESESNASPK